MQEFEKFTISDDGVLTVKSGVTSIERNDFMFFPGSIKRVILPDGIKTIGANAFENFTSMTEINLPDSIEPDGIDSRAFTKCTSLQHLKLPKNLIVIRQELCFNCPNLRSVEVGDKIKHIEKLAFGKCASLTSFKCPDDLMYIEDGAFIDCANLSDFVFNDKLKVVEYDVFSDTKLTRLELPDSVEIFLAATSGNDFEFVSIPYNADFDRVDSFEEFEIRFKDKNLRGNRDEMGSIITGDKHYGAILADCNTIGSNSKVLEVVPRGSNLYFADRQGNLVIMPISDIRSKVTQWNGLEQLRAKEFPKLLDFYFARKSDKMPLPHITVVTGMPRDEIPQFYKDNNAKNWGEISKIANCKTNEGKGSLFGLAHALGVFSNDGKESKEATDYIKMYVLDNYSEEQIHEMFNFNSQKTPFNPEFAKFFMQNFHKNPRFLQSTDQITGITTDYMNAAHDSFDKVLEAFPNKRVITRQDNERLTPEIVSKFLNNTSYENVTEELLPLAKTVSKFGYSKEAFNKLSEWYKEGISIPVDKMQLFCKTDPALHLSPTSMGGENVVTYELLDKKNPLAAVLGDITNCCQRANSVGGGCVKYGMSEPNSGFVVLRAGNQIIGQAWVWYDEKTKQITLDNIEVPHVARQKIEQDNILQQNVLNCLNRLSVGFFKGMKEKGLDVEQITIGKGYNDFNNILAKNYDTVKQPKMLTDYSGYSDAAQQFLLANQRNFEHDINKFQDVEESAHAR